ncbi:MAG: hypothetical protein JSW09_05665, partial [Pseudomonadota bacterium]
FQFASRRFLDEVQISDSLTGHPKKNASAATSMTSINQRPLSRISSSAQATMRSQTDTWPCELVHISLQEAILCLPK